MRPDVIVAAVGAAPKIPDIPGIEYAVHALEVYLSLIHISFKHRIVASPAMAGIIAPDGAFPEDQYRIYEQKAAGGCACV